MHDNANNKNFSHIETHTSSCMTTPLTKCLVTQTRTYRVTFPIFPHISRKKRDISKFQTASVQASFFQGDRVLWFWKTYPVLREIGRTYLRMDWPFPIFPHISRTLWYILKIQTTSVYASCFLGDTSLWFWKTYPVLRKIEHTHLLNDWPFPIVPHISRSKWDILNF